MRRVEAVCLSANPRIRSDLDRDRMLVLSLVKDVEIIGEAAAHITDDTGEHPPRFLELNCWHEESADLCLL